MHEPYRPIPYSTSRAWLHHVYVVLAAGTVCLIAYGGLVHSAGAGLSVPDWPTTYGQNMFAFPVSQWTGGILYEHGHRLLASAIGMLSILAAALAWIVDHRRWVRVLSIVALCAVIAQGVLGGLTVLLRLPTAVSVAHALLAPSFLLMAVALAAGTSRTWIAGKPAREIVAGPGTRRLFVATVAAVFVQIALGAVTRHTYSGMAIADFPLANGKLVPDFTSFGVAIQFAHRVGAAVVAVLVAAETIAVLRDARLTLLRVPAVLLSCAVAVQIALGAAVIWTREAILPNTLHVAGGALVLLCAFLVALRARRWYRFVAPMPAPALRVREAGA